MLTSAGFRVGR